MRLIEMRNVIQDCVLSVANMRTSKKPPCVECKRHTVDTDWNEWLGTTFHFCYSKRIDMVSGERFYHKCSWYRYSPFCKFESKAGEQEEPTLLSDIEQYAKLKAKFEGVDEQSIAEEMKEKYEDELYFW